MRWPSDLPLNQANLDAVVLMHDLLYRVAAGAEHLFFERAEEAS